MAKLQVNGTAGPDAIKLGGFESKLVNPYDGFEMFAGDGDDHIIGSTKHDILRGEAGKDTLEGYKGDDTLIGGAGDDTLDGGEGRDTVSYQGELNFVEVDLAAGTGKVFPGLTLGFITPEVDTLTSIENATAGDGGSRLLGNDQGNVLTGGAGRDTLTGRGGNDTLIGGTNVDTASYAYAGQNFVDVNLLNGSAKVVSPANLVLEQDRLAEIENVIAGNGGSRMIGDAADNEFTGGDGRDELRGGVGNDRLFGGANKDTLDGGENDDTLDGGAGDDTMTGGDGIDTASYANETFFVSVNLADGTGKVVSPANLVTQHDTLSGIENVTAGSGGSLLKGDGNNNVLTGGAGRDEIYGQGGYDTLIGGAEGDWLDGGTEDDTIFGGLGNDTIIGGAGVDTVSYSGQSGYLEVTLGSWYQAQGTGRIMSGTVELERDTLSGVENATAGDFGSTMNGSIFDNILTGGAGVDTLRGYRGYDTLIGGDGDDTLEGGLHGDLLIGGRGNDTIDGGEGTDRVSYAGEAGWIQANLTWGYARVDTDPENDVYEEEDALTSIENFVAGDGGSWVVGTGLDNELGGGLGRDTFFALDGNDTLDGWNGDDTLWGGGNDDTLIGGDGVDFLAGGSGVNTLMGGANADTFYYNPQELAGANGAQYEAFNTILDFDATSEEHDVIHIEYLSLMTDIAYDATAQEAIDGGYLVFVQSGADTTVMLDQNGGTPMPEDLRVLFVLENVEAGSLGAQHFIV
jgi:Ca2+-binding RTX toxin-like protein